MPKSQIIKDLVDGVVPLEQSLHRLFLLAVDTKNVPLAEWVQKELNGYKTGETLPDYRYVPNVELQYNGFDDRSQVKGAPLPNNVLGERTMEKISSVGVYDGLHYVEELARRSEPITRDLSFLSQQVSDSSHGMIACTSIFQVIPPSYFQSLCSYIRNRAVIALTGMEQLYGNLDALEPDLSGKYLQLDACNASLNRIVFNVDTPALLAEKKPWFSKLPWPILTALLGAVAGAGVTALLFHIFG